MKIGIIVIGYNRPKSLERLIHSILDARYENEENIDLIISIDKSEKENEILKIAESVVWERGEKIVRVFKERQGLRNHVLQCGDLSINYDAIILLEDDITVSKNYFQYVYDAVKFYKNEDKVAGISLYKILFHQGVKRFFEPDNNGYDAYFMQYAQSWGQCWTKEMWKKFREWYNMNKDLNLNTGDILPMYIVNWNNQSWLKYYMYYIVQQDKYFVYPSISLTTNYSEIGEHCAEQINDYQVPILNGTKDFKFPVFENGLKYDIFLERMDIDKLIFPELYGKKILDLYGSRHNYEDARYVISTRELPYKKIKSIGLIRRPIELNCIEPNFGKGIYVYDMLEDSKEHKTYTNYITRYDTRGLPWKRLLELGFISLIRAIINRIRNK